MHDNTSMRPDLVTNLPIRLNRASTDPIPAQIADHIRILVGRGLLKPCLSYTSPSPRDISGPRMPSSPRLKTLMSEVADPCPRRIDLTASRVHATGPTQLRPP
ncbi:hypothetical protein [Corynebacterium belfantii]|uniref:hypothetical protein n=1 Tax=Corynebacterium belfantii TaxID=2014537 RepID=UPI0018D3F82C|nr:hypothetical protein [Corynebacterium belfantii]MBG9266999.1 hypothetical protein [Corynebacterium belfantii]